MHEAQQYPGLLPPNLVQDTGLLLPPGQLPDPDTVHRIEKAGSRCRGPIGLVEMDPVNCIAGPKQTNSRPRFDTKLAGGGS